MEYTVEIAIQPRRPLTERVLFGVSEIGGVAVGSIGGRHLETTLTVTAQDARGAAAKAIDIVAERIPGHVVAVEAMTTGEADRRLEDGRNAG